MTTRALALCARNLRRLRRGAGIGIDELARAAGLPAATLLAIEEGLGDIGIDELARLAERVGVPLRVFFCNETSHDVAAVPSRRAG